MKKLKIIKLFIGLVLVFTVTITMFTGCGGKSEKGYADVEIGDVYSAEFVDALSDLDEQEAFTISMTTKLGYISLKSKISIDQTNKKYAVVVYDAQGEIDSGAWVIKENDDYMIHYNMNYNNNPYKLSYVISENDLTSMIESYYSQKPAIDFSDVDSCVDLVETVKNAIGAISEIEGYEGFSITVGDVVVSGRNYDDGTKSMIVKTTMTVDIGSSVDIDYSYEYKVKNDKFTQMVIRITTPVISSTITMDFSYNFDESLMLSNYNGYEMLKMKLVDRDNSESEIEFEVDESICTLESLERKIKDEYQLNEGAEINFSIGDYFTTDIEENLNIYQILNDDSDLYDYFEDGYIKIYFEIENDGE